MRSAAVWLITMMLGGSLSAAADVALISQGREVRLEDHLVPGKLVLFDFFAEWCAPCRIIEPRLDQLAERYQDRLAVRKVDVVDWSSPVARQHDIGVLPHLVLYDAAGRLATEGDPEQVLAVLEERLGGAAAARPVVGRRAVGWAAAVAVAAVAAVALLRRRGGRPQSSAPLDAGRPGADADTAPRIWLLVVPGGVEGPFTVGQLTELRSQRRLDGGTRVRRRGEAVWHRLDEVIERAGR